MRHRIYGKHLGRNKDERDNLFKGLTSALLLHGTIQTSSTKAKAIKGLVDKIINLAKNKNMRLGSFVPDKILRERLTKDIIPSLGAKNSGYTSTVRLGKRPGDQTMMVRMSLIGAEKLEPIEKESKGVRRVKESEVEKVSNTQKEPGKKAVSAKVKATLKKKKPKDKTKRKSEVKRAKR